MNSIKNKINEIRDWPIDKQRNFSISVALFLTLLVIGINYGIGIVWHEEKPTSFFQDKENPMNKISEAFQRNLDVVQPVLDKAFTDKSVWSSSSTDKLLEDLNSTSSSLSTSTNVVR